MTSSTLLKPRAWITGTATTTPVNPSESNRMGKRVLLIDADVLAYVAASSREVATHWGDGHWTWHCEFDEVVSSFDTAVAALVDSLSADSVTLCLTDSEGNFRKGVYGSYKGHRSKVKKPLVLKAFKDFLIAERGAYFKPGLEGDDCMGILATRANPMKEERIIVSIDKDMKTIPGLYFNDGHPEDGVQRITEMDADLWFYKQVLMGDATDGYPGCPGVGPKKADDILNINPDQADTLERMPDDVRGIVWRSIVRAYEKAGLSEDDAIVQARCARILRASDYDFKKKEPILWTP